MATVTAKIPLLELSTIDWWKKSFYGDPETGILYRIRPGVHEIWYDQVSNEGQRAKVFVKKTQLLQYRVLWLLWTGEEPNIIDHINGNFNDNRRINLRSCTISDNHCNRHIPIISASGIKNVSQYGPSGLWRVQIQKGGTKLSLHGFHTKEEAEKAAISVDNNIIEDEI
jgi:hypothetical protein